MSKYPEVITDEILHNNAHLSDDEIIQDIRDTAVEISIEQEKYDGYKILANHDRMAYFRAHAAQSAIASRQDFISFLQKLLDARKLTNSELAR